MSLSFKSLVKNIGKDNFKFDSKLLDLVKKKVFCPYEYKSGFEKFDEGLPGKDKFCS